jgi:hypothetical protein
MSWISNLFGKNGKSNTVPAPEIPENIFIEKANTDAETGANTQPDPAQYSIHMVYSFLSKDYHQVGYDDALVYPDTSYRAEKVLEIQGDLKIVIWRSKTFYEDAIKELNFLIESRNRLGMVDVVDELKMRKEKADDHYKKILELQKEVMEQGESHRLIISYKRGFQNGMAAIAIHESNKRNF